MVVTSVLVAAGVCSGALYLSSGSAESEWVKKECGCEKQCDPEADVGLHHETRGPLVHVDFQTLLRTGSLYSSVLPDRQVRCGGSIAAACVFARRY